jgi:hypothetical protein
LQDLPDIPVIWLSHGDDQISCLPSGSHWVLWQSGAQSSKTSAPNQRSQGLTIEPLKDTEIDASYRALRSQLQQYVAKS